ncbi:hypothetical protein LXT21_27925 [Myxococcus sp. K38C18041901]|uniref:hypothetical protein n=1 Tax=Myxococcus guangdongensis TaxID=2906760 RepID=UPI0020A78E38|nr:hypothetical protein [Myxococcus guangdongensis]MCP3062619.1 hypothetical protein [Myxococcus guangdongensis]
MAVAITGFSVLLCGGGCTANARSNEDAEPAAATEPRRQATPSEGEVSELWNSVSGLRAEVRELRREVSKLRAQVDAGGTNGAGARAQGTGGSGPTTADREPASPARAARADDARATASDASARAGNTGAASDEGASAQGTGGSGTQPRPEDGTGTARDVPPAGTNVPAPVGTAVVTATYSGVVRSVAPPDVVIGQDSGEALTLEVGPRTRVLREGRSIGVRDLDPGDRVYAVVDMVGQHETMEISVVRKEAPED